MRKLVLVGIVFLGSLIPVVAQAANTRDVTPVRWSTQRYTDRQGTRPTAGIRLRATMRGSEAALDRAAQDVQARITEQKIPGARVALRETLRDRLHGLVVHDPAKQQKTIEVVASDSNITGYQAVTRARDALGLPLNGNSSKLWQAKEHIADQLLGKTIGLVWRIKLGIAMRQMMSR